MALRINIAICIHVRLEFVSSVPNACGGRNRALSCTYILQGNEKASAMPWQSLDCRCRITGFPSQDPKSFMSTSADGKKTC